MTLIDIRQHAGMKISTVAIALAVTALTSVNALKRQKKKKTRGGLI